MVAMKRQRESEEATESLEFGKCLMLLSRSQESKPSHNSLAPSEFECKTCNRKFSSFQALGGHRASHKRPKLWGEELKEQGKCLSLGINKPKMHECSVCGLGFSLGQALGGHMRKHRGFSSINQVIAKVPVLKRSNSKRVMCLDLDLNLTPLENESLTLGKKAPQVPLSLF